MKDGPEMHPESQDIEKPGERVADEGAHRFSHRGDIFHDGFTSVDEGDNIFQVMACVVVAMATILEGFEFGGQEKPR